MDNKGLSQKILSGDRRAAARMITLLENNERSAVDELKQLYKHTGKAHIIGITGPPGAGKSTVTDRAASYLINLGKRVGIIAVDPTSPFTGGAILGDRIRMQDLAVNPSVFIRSMGTRGHLGGLSKATGAAVRVLDAFGCDYVFVETVGVGQSEIEIVGMADTTVIVMVPGLGDDIQAIKAGIMEIGDIFTVNKSDREGADRLVTEINAALDFYNYDRRPAVVKTTALTGEGIDELCVNIINHMEYLKESNKLQDRRKNNIKTEIIELIKQEIIERVYSHKGNGLIDELSLEAVSRIIDPYSAAEKILKDIYI